MGDASGEDGGLAGAGASNDEQRPLAVGDGLALGTREPLEDRVVGGASAIRSAGKDEALDGAAATVASHGVDRPVERPGEPRRSVARRGVDDHDERLSPRA